MATIWSAEYNRRIAIIEDLRSERSATEIIRFFRYPRHCLWRCGKMALEQSNEGSSERVIRKNIAKTSAIVDRTDFGWPRAIVARSDGCSEAVDGNCDIRKAIHFSAGRCTGSYESFDSKLTLRQCRYVLIQGILASQQSRFKSLGLLCMERSWKGHKQVSASQCDVIKDRYWGSICRHGQRYIAACIRTLQTENRGRHSS